MIEQEQSPFPNQLKPDIRFLGHCVWRPQEDLISKYALYHPTHGKPRPGGCKILFHKYAAKLINPENPCTERTLIMHVWTFYDLITHVLTICHVKLTQSTVLEQKCFDLPLLWPALCNLWLLLVIKCIFYRSSGEIVPTCIQVSKL